MCASGSPLRFDLQCDRQAMCVCVLERIWTPLHIVWKLHWNLYQSGVVSPLRVALKAPTTHCVFRAVFTSALTRCAEIICGTCSPTPLGNIEKHQKNIWGTYSSNVSEMFHIWKRVGEHVLQMFSKCSPNVLQCSSPVGATLRL